MEQNKKRRNSILKKKTATDEETTTEIKARRISFSGKKSVKEFIAGEEAATIWGTSYEESADDLHGNSTERSLVNVNGKRIELRNRRVVVEPQPQKRRSYIKKKVLIAENDKENLCVKSMPPRVENQLEAQPPPPAPNVEIKQPQSPKKPELALVKSQVDTSKIGEIMSPIKPSVDPISICSTTFDFINYSGQISKTISIEQSVDVTLSDFELQMFRFRVPVRSTDISPNLSVNSQRDGSSPNILSQSILMSAEELKTMKVQKGAMKHDTNKTNTEQKLKAIEANKVDEMDMDIEETSQHSEEPKAMSQGADSQSMEITHISGSKGSKRKSDRTPQSLIKDSMLTETNSPLRKKPMHTLYISSMDVTNNDVEGSSQKQLNGRPTINETIAVDESFVGKQSLSATNTSRYTIFDHITINESTIYSHTTASCLAMGDEIENISMELSMCENNNSKTCSDIAPDVQCNTQASHKTIHFPRDGEMEYSMGGGQKSAHMNPEANVNALIDKTIKSPINILEDSIQTQPISEIRRTVYDSADIENITEPFDHGGSSSNIRKQRQSIHTPIDMVEESLNSKQPLQKVKSSYISFVSKGLKVRQTILTPKNIVEYTPKEDEPRSELQKTIKTPVNIFEDSIQAEPMPKSITKGRQTLYDSADIEEVTAPLEKEIVRSKNNKPRESIYTQIDMIESSPKLTQSENTHKTSCLQKPKDYTSGLKMRQTTFTTEDIVVDSAEGQECRHVSKKSPTTALYESPLQSEPEDSPEPTQLPKPKAALGNVRKRKTVSTPKDIVEDSLKEIESKSMLQRTIKTPLDICEDTPQAKPGPKTIGKSRKTVYESADIEEQTVPIEHADISSKPQSKSHVKGRETIFDSVDIEEEPSGTVQHGKSNNPRNSVYTPSDMMEESPKPSKPLKAHKEYSSKPSNASQDHKIGQKIFTSKDIIPDTSDEPRNELQKTIKTPMTIFEDSIQDQPVSKPIAKDRHTIYGPADIEEETVAIQQETVLSKNNKPRKSIYAPSDMIEEYPKPQKEQYLQKPKISTSGLKLRRTIFTPEGIVVDSAQEQKSRHDLHKSATTGIFEDPLQLQPVLKPSVQNRPTIYESAAIEEDSLPVERAVSISKAKKTRESIHFPSDMIEDSPKPTQPPKVESKPKSASGGVRVRHTILTPKDIVEDFTKEMESKSILQRIVKTPSDISEDCLQTAAAPKAIGKSRQTIYESAEIEEETMPFKHKIASCELDYKEIIKGRETIYDSADIEEFSSPIQHEKSNRLRKSVLTSDIMEESPKPSQPITAQKAHCSSTSYAHQETQMVQADPIPKYLIEDTPDKSKPRSILQKTIKTPITIFEDSIQDEPVLDSIAKKRQTIYDFADIEDETVSIPKSVHSDMDGENPKATLPLNTHKGQFMQKPVASTSGLQQRRTIFTPEDIIVDSAQEVESGNIVQESTKSDCFEDPFQSEPASKPSVKIRPTIFESADIEEDPGRAFSTSKTHRARESINFPSDMMIDDSPKHIQCPETQSKQEAAPSGPRVLETIMTQEDIVEDVPKKIESMNCQSSIKTPFDISPSPKLINRNRQTVYDSADIEEDRLPIQHEIASSEPESKSIVKGRQTIYDSAEIEENTVPIEHAMIVLRNNKPTYTQSVVTAESSKPTLSLSQKLIAPTSAPKARQTILTPKDIIMDSTQEVESRSILRKSNKTDPQKVEPASKPFVKVRPTIFESTDIEEDSEPIQHAISIYKTKRPRESIYLPSDMIEDSPKPTQPTKSQSKPEVASGGVSLRQTEDDLRAAPSLKPIGKSRQTIFDSADIEEETVPVKHAIASPKPEHKKSIRGRDTVYDSVDVEEASSPIQHGIALNKCNKARKSVYAPIDMVVESPNLTQEALKAYSSTESKFSQEIQAFNPKCLFEDTSNDTDHRNVLQRTNKTLFNIFEDSIQAEQVSKSVVKGRQTIFDAIDIEEPSVPIQHSIHLSKMNKPRESTYSPNDMIEDSPKPVQPLNELSIPAGKSGGLRLRQTILTQENIVQDIPKETQFQNTLQSTFEAPNAISEDNLRLATKQIGKTRQTFYDYADIEEETVPIQRTTASSKTASKQFNRETIYNLVDVEETLGRFEHEVAPNKSNSSRKSVYANIDMDIDSPKTINPIQGYNKAIQRQTTYESCNVISDTSTMAKSKQTIEIQEDVAKTLSKMANSTDQSNNVQTKHTSLKEKVSHRQTVHTPVDMIQDSSEPKTDITETTDELLQQGTKDEDLILEKRSDLKFRKPTKLFSANMKSPENPYHSQKSLMDQFIQDMGCSMDLQVMFSSETSLQKPSFLKPSPIEFEPSTNLSIAENSRQDAAQVDISMELSGATETIPNTRKQQTMHLNEPFEMDGESGSLVDQMKYSTAQINRKTIHFRKNIDWEESQMSKYLETPSKFDRSLAEYLKAEAAALRSSSKEMSKEDQEEEIFYDAEDGAADEILNEKRQTCHVPVNILEESGIQPIQMDVLKRQTTFSPKDMTNDAIDDGQSSLTGRKNDKDLPTRQNETRPNVSDNRIQKQTFDFPRKCLFQKSSEPKHMMEVTQTSDTTDEIKKPILMKSRLGLHVSKPTYEIIPEKLANEENEERKEQETSMDESMLIENTDKPLSPKKPFVRKTIHFSNENTVDESFFDENTSKPSLEKNRKTLHFNEPIQTTDVSKTWNKPSSSIQSVKEMLLENTRLFSQTNLLKPSTFEKQRSTIFFADKDNSMEVSSMDCGPTDPECTPTKSKISRIPQLIGSAKKMESMKKSMEFIQQELPNLGYHHHHEMEEDSFQSACESPKEIEQETPRRVSTSVPKKLKESFHQYDLSQKESNFQPKQLENSFDTIEIPRKAIVSGTKAKEKSPRKVVRQLQESFDTIEIPRKVLSSVRKTIEESPGKELPLQLEEPINARLTQAEPGILQESFDTVEIPRRATTFQRNDTAYFCPNEMELTTNATQKSLYQFEDAPITVSDVSTFFAQKQLPTADQANAKYSPNTTETLCKLNVNEVQVLPRPSDSDDGTINLAKYQKRYIDLTCNSLELSDLKDAIEKTHLSLVNTIDDASEMVNSPPEIELTTKIAAVISPPKEEPEPLKPVASVCRKCKRHQLSDTQNDTTVGSFMLEPLPVYKMDLNALRQLESKPKLSDVGNILRQKLRESDSFNVSDESRSVILDEDDDSDDSVDIDSLVLNLEKERLMNSKNRNRQLKEVKTEKSFVHKVWKKIQSKSNWILNDLLLTNNVLRLSHTRIRTFAIFIDFTPKDPRGIEVNFNKIQLLPNRLHSRQWKPFEYALHYQLLVELPFDLKKICPTSEHLFEFLEYVEQVAEDVLRTGKDMLSIVLSSPASLIRDPSGSLYIRKYVRTKTPQNEVKRTEIHIEVRNIKKLSYESITMPPLYEFHENIQLLPVGHNFLRIFLDDPLKFIK